MDKEKLYDTITQRKIKQKDFEPYDGNNGRVNRCVELFKKKILKTGGTLVDVGGGIGDLCYSLRDSFDNIVCLDISKKNLEAAKAKGALISRCDLDKHGIDLTVHIIPGFGAIGTNEEWEWTKKNPCVDVITALDVIEHLVDPEYFARECFDVLKSDGQVFINTPNIQFWRHLEQLLYEGTFPQTSGDKEVWGGGHFSFFTYKDLEKIFTTVGFVNCTQLKDEECFEQPPEMLINLVKPKTQKEYVKRCIDLGNPNLLFKCEKE